MRLLLSKLSQQAGDVVARQSQLIESDTITIGRATDQIIHSLDPSVALRHAVIGTSIGGKLVVRSIAKTGLLVNGSPSQRSEIAPGDVIELGNLTITVEQPSNGSDVALAVQATSVEYNSTDLEQRYALNLSRAGLKNRRWAWVWGLGILGLFLGLPLAAFLLQDSQPELVTQLRASPLPSDGAWLSGPLHKSHKFIGDACEACHVKPFVAVRDDECIACHSEMRHHADPATFAMPELDQTRCAVCHQSHHEPSALIMASESQCTDCHTELSTHFADSQLGNVSSFVAGAANGHPQFKVTMQLPGEAGGTAWQSLDDDQLTDPSGLKFPHAKHMKAEGIKTPNGIEIMQCDSCHQTDRAGHSMLTINFEQHCQSCHSLDFAGEQPNRQVPHGSPDIVLATIREFYAAKHLAELEAEMQASGLRQRPGREARQVAMQAADDEAVTVAGELFEKRACNVCHTVNNVAENGEPEWRIAPVKLTEVWMPRAKFTHSPHETLACVDCHTALDSEQASDVLMPGIDNCQQCHGDSNSTGLLQTGCVGCHGFHNASMPIMRTIAPANKKAVTP